MTDNNWKQSFDLEIQMAENARTASNEGMARVCARRAAGIAVGRYLQIHNHPEIGPSAVNRIQYLISLPYIDQDAKTIAAHLLVRVGTDHNLPIDVDLISEAKELAEILFEPERN